MEFQINSKEPIYTQIKNHLKKMIVKGELRGGERVLSVRECANELKVNPNTIQRAYTELEEENLIYTQRGIGKFVTEDEDKIREVKVDMFKHIVNSFVKESKEIGFTKDEVIEIIQKSY